MNDLVGRAPREWTPEQRDAIEAMEPNVVVSAGAGSGKTGVLVERFLRIVLQSRDESLPPAVRAGVQNILVITFTEKATKEVKGRIVEQLLIHGLHEERRQVETAYISTIHGFCSRLLKENPFEAGLPPDYTVLEDAEATRRLHLAVALAVEEAYRGGRRELMELVRALQEESLYGQRQRNPLALLARCTQETLGTLRGTGMRLPGLRSLIDQGPEAMRARSHGPLARLLHPVVSEVRAAAQALRALRAGATGALELARLRLIECADGLPNISDESAEPAQTSETLKALAEVAGNADSVARHRRAVSAADLELLHIVDRLRYAVDIARKLFAFQDEAEERAQAICLWLWELLYRAWTHYEAWKRSAGYLDHDDLQAEAAHLLESHAEVLDRYRRKLRHVMVDEFQDTSPVQMRIIRLLTETNGSVTTPRFLVGDVQQSIYGFRNARPDLMAAEMRRAGADGEGRVVRLKSNFRSRPEILTFVNHLFRGIWSHSTTVGQELAVGAAYEPCSVPCVEALVGTPGSAATFRELQARAIAARVLHLVQTQEVRITARGSPRCGEPVRYRDIAILMRAATHVELLEKAFTALRVPYYVVGGGRNYYARQEVRDVVNALTVVDNLLDDFALAGTLRSPLVGLTADALYEVRRNAVHPSGVRLPLYFGIARAMEAGKLAEEDAARLSEFVETIGRLRMERDRLSPGEMLECMVRDFAYDARLLVRPNGRQRVANLRKLQQMAYAASDAGLSEFVEQLRDLETLALREGDAPTEEEAADVVRIFTIHRAKGLEFPVVIVTDVSQPLERETRDLFLCDPSELALGCNVGGYKSLTFRALEEQRTRAGLEEEMRVLYVALTRAQERLILSGQALPRGKTSWATVLFPVLGIAGPPAAPGEMMSPAEVRVSHQPIQVWSDAFGAGQPKVS